MDMPELHLYQQLLLLCISDNSGKVIRQARHVLDLGLAGAALMDLSMQGKIGLKGKTVAVNDPASTGDPAFDAVIERVANAKKPHKAGYWLRDLSSRNLYALASQRLEEQGYFHSDKRTILWSIPYPGSTIPGAPVKFAVKLHMRSLILAGEPAELQDILLLQMVRDLGLVDILFTRDERKAAKAEIQELSRQEAAQAYAWIFKTLKAEAKGT